MKPILHLTFVAAAAALVGAGQAAAAPVDTSKIADAIRAGEVQWNADVAARDPAKFVAHYANDAIVMNPFAAPLHGLAEISRAIKQIFADPNFTLVFTLDNIQVAPGGDMAVTQGHCTETETDPASHAKVTNACSYATVYRPQADGAWKAVVDIASPTAPPK